MKWIVNVINWLLTPFPVWIAANADYSEEPCEGYHIRFLDDTACRINDWANKWNIPLHIGEMTEYRYVVDAEGKLDSVEHVRSWMWIEFTTQRYRLEKFKQSLANLPSFKQKPQAQHD